MAIDGDDMVSLPAPPPPRPAARRQAIDSALRKFDGIEEPATPHEARRRPAWTTMHRRPAAALAAAALFAVVAIPVIQIAIRDYPAEEVISQERPSAPVRSTPGAAPGTAQSEAPPPRPDQMVADATPSSPPQRPAPSIAAEERGEFASADSARKAETEPPAAVTAAPAPPPPPPPPPPPAEPQAEAAASREIVVTGSRIPRSSLEAAGPMTAIAPFDEFLSRLQAGLRANDRRAVIGLVGFPLRVNFEGGVRIYRSRREVERDYDRIFTAEVRQAAFNLRPGTSGNPRLRFGPARDGSIRLVEVNP